MVGVFMVRETPDQHHFRPIQVLRVLPVVVTEGEGDGLDLAGLRLGQVLEQPGPLLRGELEAEGQPFEDRAHDVEGVDAVGAGLRPHHPPQLVGDQRVDDHGLAVAGFVDHGMDLPRRADVGPADQADRRVLKLDQRRADHPLGGVAGGVGNHEDGEHPFATALEILLAEDG